MMIIFFGKVDNITQESPFSYRASDPAIAMSVSSKYQTESKGSTISHPFYSISSFCFVKMTCRLTELKASFN